MTKKEKYKNGIKIDNFFDILNFWKNNKIIQGCIDKPNTSFITSDIHGDLNSLLNFLLATKFVSFAKDQDAYKVYKINDKDTIKIPNLIINKDFDKNIYILGDLIDRGPFSDECLYLVKDIIEQIEALKDTNKNLKDRFQFIIGNHEIQSMLTEYGFFRTIESLYNIGGEHKFNNRKYSLLNMLAKDYIKLCTNIGNNVLGSHAAFKNEEIYNIVKFIEIDYNVSDDIKELASKFYALNKNYNRKELKYESLLVLEEFLNKLSKFIILNYKTFDFEKRKLYTKILHEISSQLTKDSVLSETNGLFQVVGHEANLDHKAFIKLNTLYADFDQTCGFSDHNGYSFPTYLVFNKDTNIFNTISLCENLQTNEYEQTVSQTIKIPNMYFDYISEKIDKNELLTIDEMKYPKVAMSEISSPVLSKSDYEFMLNNFYTKLIKLDKKIADYIDKNNVILEKDFIQPSSTSLHPKTIFNSSSITILDEEKKPSCFSCFKRNETKLKSNKTLENIEKRNNKNRNISISFYN